MFLKRRLFKGFTLIEVLVAVTVGILIILLTYASHSLVVRMTERESRKIELVQNGRVALDRITRELRQSDELVTILPEVGDDPGNLPPTEIIFQDGHALDPISYVRYYLDANYLHRELSHYSFDTDPGVWVYWNAEDEFGGSASQTIDDDDIIAEYINNLIFWGGDRLINVSFSTSSSDDDVEFLTKVCGRNLR